MFARKVFQTVATLKAAPMCTRQVMAVQAQRGIISELALQSASSGLDASAKGGDVELWKET